MKVFYAISLIHNVKLNLGCTQTGVPRCLNSISCCLHVSQFLWAVHAVNDGNVGTLKQCVENYHFLVYLMLFSLYLKILKIFVNSIFS